MTIDEGIHKIKRKNETDHSTICIDIKDDKRKGRMSACMRPKKLRYRCGNEFSDYTVRDNGSANQSAYESCRDCYLKSRKPGRESRGRRSSVAAAASGGQGFNPTSTDCSTKRDVRISFATIAHTNAKRPKKSTRGPDLPQLWRSKYL